MKDPARIDRILDALSEYWHANPYLRLGQILKHATPIDQMVFYLSDDHLEKWLEDAAKPHGPISLTELMNSPVMREAIAEQVANTVVDLDSRRPHEYGYVTCSGCGFRFMSVRPVGVAKLECPKCGAMTEGEA